MGGGPSKLSAEQLDEVQRLLQQWTQNQNHDTNMALGSQHRRITDLMSQLSERLTDRQNQTTDRLEIQINELKQQLESMQKMVDKKDGTGPSISCVSDFLNELTGILGKKSEANLPQKTPFANHSSSMGRPQGFGPCVMQQNYGGSHYSPRGYPNPHHTNPNMPLQPGFHQNFYPNPPPPTYQQSPPPLMGIHQGNPQFPRNFAAPNTPGAPNQHQQKQIIKNASTKPTGKTKYQTEKSKTLQQNLTMPSVVDVSTTKARKSTDPKISSITQRFEETRKEMLLQKKKPVKLEDIEEAIAQFKLQQIENDKENTGSSKHFEKFASTETHDRNNDLAEKINRSNAKRFDKTESRNRRDQYKSRGRGRGFYKDRKSENRQARKKTNPRKMKNDESDSDSNESVVNDFSTTSKASTVPTARNKKVFWTTRPNYARDYHFERVQSRLLSVTMRLNLGDYKGTPDSDEQPGDQNRLNEKIEGKKNSKEKRDAKPSTSRDSNLKLWAYPSEEEAKAKGEDIQKPLKKPVLFIGLTKSGEHHTHNPKCLADIYDLEKIYENFELISLTL